MLNDYRDEFCPDGEINDLFDDFANAGLLDCPKCGKANMRKYEWTDAARQQMAIECDNCGHIYTADLSIEGIDKVLSPEAEVQEP